MTNYGSNTVSVIDTSINSVIATVAVGSQPAGLDSTPDGRFVYVANSGDDTVSVIATATNSVVTTVAVGHAPSAVAAVPAASAVYVANSADDSVSEIDLATNTVSATLVGDLSMSAMAGPPFFGNAPDRLGVTPDGLHVYIPNTRPNNRPLSVSLAIVDTQAHTMSRTPSLAAIDNPGWTLAGGVAISADGSTGYATAWFGYVEVFDTATNLQTNAFTLSDGNSGISLAGIAIHPQTGKLYIAAQEQDAVYVVNPANPLPGTLIPLDASPHAVTTRPDGSAAYVTLGNDSRIAVIDTSSDSVQSTIPVGLNPFDLILVTSNDETAPSVSCDGGPGGWSATNVDVTCHADDDGTGLADSNDATFHLTTSVASGMETDSAATGSRVVCDAAGNCVTIGPFEFKVDRRPPSVVVQTPAATSYLLHQCVLANYSCTDTGSGIATCEGPVNSGDSLETSSAGTHTFHVTATDVAGNGASGDVTYTVRFGVTPLFDQGKAAKSGSTIPIKLDLVDSNGANVSSPSIQVTATSIVFVASSSTVGVDDSGNANPDLNFRYDPGLGGYVFNLSTKGLAIGAYQLRFTVAGDPTQYAVGFLIGK